MADKITFTGAILESFSRNGKCGKAHFSSSMNQAVSRVMGWEDIPEFLTGATLEGDLHATQIVMIPTEKQLEKHAVNLDVSRVGKFQSIRLEIEGKKGKGHRTELRFEVAFPDITGCRKLEEWMLTIGEGKSRLTVSYTKQDNLPGVELPGGETDEQGELVQ